MTAPARRFKRLDPVHRRERASERMRRYRARLRAGTVVAQVPVTFSVVDMLIDRGWLAIEQSEDRDNIGAAIAALLEDAAHND